MIDEKEFTELTEFALQEDADINTLIRDSGLDPAADFQEFDFSDMYLPGTIFTGFNLRGSNFRNAVLPDSVFRASNLQGSDFSGANLRRADFSESMIDDAFFKGAYLERAVGVDPAPTVASARKGGTVIFVDDEPESIQTNIKILDDILPWVEIVIVKSESEGLEQITSKNFLFAVIDARIPAQPGGNATALLGAEIAQNLSSGKVSPSNKSMHYALLTEHKLAIQEDRFEKDPRRIGIIEKDESMQLFEIVLRQVHYLASLI